MAKGGSCRNACRTIAFWRLLDAGVSASCGTRLSSAAASFSRWGLTTAACTRHPRRGVARRAICARCRVNDGEERAEKLLLSARINEARSTIRWTLVRANVRACVHTRARVFARRKHAGNGAVDRMDAADCRHADRAYVARTHVRLRRRSHARNVFGQLVLFTTALYLFP